jgi:hypothetical protein
MPKSYEESKCIFLYSQSKSLSGRFAAEVHIFIVNRVTIYGFARKIVMLIVAFISIELFDNESLVP